MSRALFIILLYGLSGLLTATVKADTEKADAEPAKQLQILILHSYSQEYPWTRDQHRAFVSTLRQQSQLPILFSTEYLDTKRHAYSQSYANYYAAHLKTKYRNYSPQIIYVTDDNAAQFAQQKLHQQFPRAAIFFSGVNNYAYLDNLKDKPVTGVFEKKDIAKNIELLHQIDPDAKQITIIGDNSNTYQAIKTEITQQLAFFPGIKAGFIASKQIDEVTQLLSAHQGKYLFLTTIGGFSDSQGKSLSLQESISRIAASGEHIIFSMEDSYLFSHVLGGYVTSGKKQGETAAQLVLQFIQGTPIGKIEPVLHSPNEFIFNFPQLKKHHIRLKPVTRNDARILNQPENFYEKNRNLIVSTIIALVLLLISLLSVFLALLSIKNRQLSNRTQQVKMQSAAIQKVKDALTTAQAIAHLGNWEWNLQTNQQTWSDEMFRILGMKPHHIKPSYEKLLSFIPEDEREHFKETIQSSLQHNQPFEIEHHIQTQEGAVRFVRQAGDVHINPLVHSKQLIATILDITAIKKNELIELERLSIVERYQNALLEWSQVDYENIEQAFERATEISSNTLNIGRVSIWLYNDDHTSIVCHNLYIQNQGHEKGMELHEHDFPRYFRALESGKMIIVNQAQSDERTNEFTAPYLKPNQIYSMLDAPILYAGKVIGVVCHEYTEQVHEWSSQEIDFAAAIAGTVSLSLEIQRRREMEKILEHQAYHDTLTNLPNRSLFLDRLDQAIKLAHRTSTLIAVLFLDLDNFKEINDSLGHEAGDQVLIQIAEKLDKSLRDMDTIARLGGDEFTLIMSSFKDIQHIHDLVLKLFNLLQQPLFIKGQELYATCSIGISIYPNDGETADTLLRNADAAMYNAKEAGRNSFEFYTHEMTERAFERVLMETNLRRALDNEEFIIYYQPQYNIKTDQLIGMEALLRWQHPEMGMVSPAKFIPVAEDTGLIVELDRWMMQTAMKQFSQWYQQGYAPGRLAMNMAAKQLEQSDLIEHIQLLLEQAECNPQWISFEITESQIMKDPEKAVSLLKQISKMGIELAVDDFGTGYSSLTYLKRLPVDKLKIDRAFINDIPYDDEDVAITQAIIALANSLNLSVIAEGVEKHEQSAFLQQHECYEVQGFLLGKPIPAEQVIDILQNKRSRSSA